MRHAQLLHRVAAVLPAADGTASAAAQQQQPLLGVVITSGVTAMDGAALLPDVLDRMRHGSAAAQQLQWLAGATAAPALSKGYGLLITGRAKQRSCLLQDVARALADAGTDVVVIAGPGPSLLPRLAGAGASSAAASLIGGSHLQACTSPAAQAQAIAAAARLHGAAAVLVDGAEAGDSAVVQV
jgi:hypothetical protein